MNRRGNVALVLAGACACPVAGGQLVLLGKPLGGVLGVPGAVVGYLALAALLTGCVTGVFARRGLSPRVAGGCAVVVGAGFAVAGLVTVPWLFTAAVLLAGAAAGPLVVAARAAGLAVTGARGAGREFGPLTPWHGAAAAGVAGAAGLAALGEQRPGMGLTVAGAVLVVLGIVARSANCAAEKQDSPLQLPRRRLLGYAAIGLAVGGTVLPALHLLLFRWNTLDADRAGLLLLAALPALLVLAFPAPHESAVTPLLILAAGGPVLVATAPGPITLAVGIAVTSTASARAARGLDQVLVDDRGALPAAPDSPRSAPSAGAIRPGPTAVANADGPAATEDRPLANDNGPLVASAGERSVVAAGSPGPGEGSSAGGHSAATAGSSGPVVWASDGGQSDPLVDARLTSAVNAGASSVGALSVLLVVAAGLAGLGLVTVLGELFGTGTALTLLALPVLIAAFVYGRGVRAQSAVLQGGLS
ncbi:hypothetical protein AB0H76_18795 [Nocardia sp. NPDC050712]|uniref:hypothetical protein n=1 Tax=Nocardia sp. NPDC050712 TaxID=3155518 RepID=UPI0033F2A8FA